MKNTSDVDPQSLMNPGQVRIQVIKITKLISNHLLKVERKKIFFQICTWTSDISCIFSFRLKKNIIFYENNPKTLLVELCFSLHFIPLDPDPRTQMIAYPTGSVSRSGSTSLQNTVVVGLEWTITQDPEYVRWGTQHITHDKILVNSTCYTCYAIYCQACHSLLPLI